WVAVLDTDGGNAGSNHSALANAQIRAAW
ncbi:MAG: hypothetical protein ACI9WU_003654, partial [Myxococcota bacterium]